MKLRTIYGAKINKLRTDKGWTLEQLAKKVYSSKSYVWELENKSRHPSVFAALRISHALDVTVEQIFDPDNRDIKP